jgi:hypothetical protein
LLLLVLPLFEDVTLLLLLVLVLGPVGLLLPRLLLLLLLVVGRGDWGLLSRCCGCRCGGRVMLELPL